MLHSVAPKWCPTTGRPRFILSVVVLLELVLFAGVHWDRWTKGLPALGRPATSTGEGLVVRSDGLGYYAWLRSLLIDGDLNFDNEFDEHNVVGDFVPSAGDRTELGRRSNPWSVGPACTWSFTVAPAHGIMLALQGHGWPWPADGYSLPYQLLVGCTTILVSCLGLFLLYGICSQFAVAHRAALAAALLTLGTTIVYYSAVEVSMAHGLGTAVVAALVWYWLRTYGQPRCRRWFLVGLLVGAAALVRWQLMTLAILPAGEALLLCGRVKPGDSPAEIRAACMRLSVAGLGALLAFLPQTVAWRWVYGRWLASPIPMSHNWLQPSGWQILFGQDRGLFYWTPLSLLALLGLLCCWLPACRADASRSTEPTREPLLLLGVAFLVQVYVLASLWGAGVYLGVSYGFRHLTELQVLLAPGLALILERAPARCFRYIAALLCLLVFWNLLLVYQYRYGLLPADGGVDLVTMLANGLHLVRRKPLWLFGQVALGPLALWLLAVPASWNLELIRPLARLTNKIVARSTPKRSIPRPCVSEQTSAGECR